MFSISSLCDCSSAGEWLKHAFSIILLLLSGIIGVPMMLFQGIRIMKLELNFVFPPFDLDMQAVKVADTTNFRERGSDDNCSSQNSDRTRQECHAHMNIEELKRMQGSIRQLILNANLHQEYETDKSFVSSTGSRHAMIRRLNFDLRTGSG
jgi:hypothetical protein